MRLNTAANVAGSLLNVALDYAMIFGHWGFPEMGIRGAAIATVVSGLVAPAVQLVVFLHCAEVRALGWRAALAPDLPLLRRLLRFGLPSGLHLVSDIGSFSIFVLMTGRLGDLALAASNIGFTINGLAFMPLVGFSIAASILVGQYQGRGDSDTAARAGWSALRIAWVYMVVVGLTFALFPSFYYTLFRSRTASYTVAELVASGRPMMFMLAAWGVFDTVNIVLAGALKGAGDTRFVMLYMLLSGWGLWIPCEWWVLTHGGGIVAAWAVLALYILALAFGFAWRWHRGRWRSIRVIAPEPPLLPTRPGAEAFGAGGVE